MLPYRQPGLELAAGRAPLPSLVRALQRDLRALGYLRSGMDGEFGPGTDAAVRALQHDLLLNDGHGSDGNAPVAMRVFNQGRVAAVTGVVNEPLAACIEEMLDDARVPKLPRSDDPVADNRRALDAVRALADAGLRVPLPFLLAILAQESDLQHFRVPTANNADDFIVVGLDRGEEGNRDHITSRGYGIGQYTLFHHPPRPDEVDLLMIDAARNVEQAVNELLAKFNNFVVGSTPGARADDRIAEIGRGPLRQCRFAATDPRFLRDCAQCAKDAPTHDIVAGMPWYPGAPGTYEPTKYHPETSYKAVPDRAKFECDWPYAVRRYNGGGTDSYHYQAQVLKRLTG